MNNQRAEARGTGMGERASSVPRHSCRRCVMNNQRAKAHGTCRRCVIDNQRAEAHGTGGGKEILLYHDIHVVGG